MARVLLAWELGGNGGHAQRLAQVVAALAGHEVSLAVQRPDALRHWRGQRGFAQIRQAPIWPGLLRDGGAMALGAPCAYGDLLAGVGLTDSAHLEYLLRAWEQLLADTRCDVLIADFAPAACLAARGRVARLVTGTGFTVPPSHLPRFPLLQGGAPAVAEPALLALVNRALWRLGHAPLDALPQIAQAERQFVASFAELDPYRAHRLEAPLAPFLSGEVGQAGDGAGVFAYLPMGRRETGTLARALGAMAARGLAVEGYFPQIGADLAREIAGQGVVLHQAPVPQAQIARAARLYVGLGGLGATSAALAAGLAQALYPVDLEKRLTAQAVARLGAGVDLRAQIEGQIGGQIGGEAAEDPAALTRALEQAYHAAAQDAPAGAAEFRARLAGPPPAEQIAQAVADLV